MAKFVCDYEQVISAGAKLVAAADAIQTAITSYQSKITSDLSGWSGSAKTSFESVSSAKVKEVQTLATNTKETGEFVQNSAKAIQDYDNQCAAQKI